MSIRKLLILLLVFFVTIDLLLLVFLKIGDLNLIALFRKLKYPKPGACLILEENNCKKVEFIEDPIDPDNLLAAYNLPDDALIFSPVDGNCSKNASFHFGDGDSDLGTYPGDLVIPKGNNFPNEKQTVYAFIYFANEEKENPSESIDKGGLVGVATGRKINYLGDYSLIVKVVEQEVVGGKWESFSGKDILVQMLKVE